MYGTKERRYSNVLVFDMGGGTTDVTIVQLIKNRNICSEEEDKILDNDNKNLGTDYREAKETFECRVIATSGDVALGGDDIDDLLTQWFLNHDDIPTDVSKTNQDVTMNPVEHRELRRICCMAKEDLCGDGKDQGPKNFVSMEYGTKRVTLSMEMFERIIEHIIQRAEDTLNLALHSFLEHVQSKGNQEFSTDSKETMPGIDEVVLVGGKYIQSIVFRLPFIPMKSCFGS
jgi:molecular chaperone DnaK (HSP70)